MGSLTTGLHINKPMEPVRNPLLSVFIWVVKVGFLAFAAYKELSVVRVPKEFEGVFILKDEVTIE